MTLIAYVHETRSKALHLRVEQETFSEHVKAALERVGTPAVWKPAIMAWDFLLSPAAVSALADRAKELGETVVWKEGLKDYAEFYIKQAETEHTVRLGIERVIKENLPLDPYVCVADPPALRHQNVTFHWSQRVQGLLLAHEPGTGKTRAATDAAGGWLRNGLIRPMIPRVNSDGSYGIEGGVLIACPKTMLKTWQEELMKWQTAQSVVIRGTAIRKRRLAATPSHFHIVNYEGLKYVMGNSYDAVIWDECHFLANHSQRTENAIIISQRTRKRLGLTGTPITNSLQSIFYPMLILDGGRSLGASRTAFLEKYFTTQRRGQFIEHEAKSDAAVRIAQAIAENTYFIKKEEVVDLPAKTHTPIYLEMTEEQSRYYKEIREHMVAYIQDTSVTTEQAAAKMQKMMQICQGFALTDDGKGRHFSDAKNEALMEMLTDQYANRKVVVWAPYQYEIQRLARALHERGINHIRIDGTVTSQTVRDEAMERWNLDPAIKVYIRQSSMSEGVTLHAKDCSVPCCDCIYLGMTYRYVDWKQSQDRIHRIGQNYPCSYLYLLTETGIDRNVYRSVLEKEKDAAAVHKEGKEYFLRLLTEKG